MTTGRLCSFSPTPAEIAEAKDRIIAVLHAHGAMTCADLEKRCDLHERIRRLAVAQLVKARQVRAMQGNKLRQWDRRTAVFIFLPGCPPTPQEYPEILVNDLQQKVNW